MGEILPTIALFFPNKKKPLGLLDNLAIVDLESNSLTTADMVASLGLVYIINMYIFFCTS